MSETLAQKAAREVRERVNKTRDERIANGLPPSDSEILKYHDERVMKRALMELQIVRRSIVDLIAAGFELEFEYDDEEPPMKIDAETKAVAELFQYDEARVFVLKDGKRRGWIFYVFGNDGWDVICDHTVNLDAALKGSEELADRLSRGY